MANTEYANTNETNGNMGAGTGADEQEKVQVSIENMDREELLGVVDIFANKIEELENEISKGRTYVADPAEPSFIGELLSEGLISQKGVDNVSTILAEMITLYSGLTSAGVSLETAQEIVQIHHAKTLEMQLNRVVQRKSTL